MGSTCGKSRAISFAENVRAFLKVWRFRRCFAAFGEKKPLPYTRKNASAPSCLQGKLRDCGLFCTPERMHPNHPLKSRSLLFNLVKTLFLVDGNKMQNKKWHKWIWIPAGYFKSVPKVQYAEFEPGRAIAPIPHCNWSCPLKKQPRG